MQLAGGALLEASDVKDTTDPFGAFGGDELTGLAAICTLIFTWCPFSGPGMGPGQ